MAIGSQGENGPLKAGFSGSLRVIWSFNKGRLQWKFEAVWRGEFN